MAQSRTFEPNTDPEAVRRSDVAAAVVLLRALARHGVTLAFGIPGGSVSPLFDALVEVPEITYVATRHEAIAAFAAMGHARMTHRPALVLTTSGPGITNAVTGIAAASVEELPLILIGGDVAMRAAGRGALQDGTSAGLDTEAILRSVTRWSYRITSPEGISGVAECAWRAALGDRPGPVFLSVPLDIGTASATRVRIVPPQRTTVHADPAACFEAATRLASAHRPLMVLGNGARSAAHEALQVAERLSAPVVVTPHAKGAFPESHDLYCGVLGVGQHPSVTEYLAQGPDVTCIVGSRLGDIATNGWSTDLRGSEAAIQIDREPWLIGRNLAVSLGIVGDAADVLRQIAGYLASNIARPIRRVGGCRSLHPESCLSDAVPLKPQRVLAALSEAFPDAIWCSDIGEHLTMALHYLRIDRPHHFHAMTGLGSMGSGIGMALGIKRTLPQATVIGLCGDGGIAMHAGELLTCAESGIGVIYAVFNDGLWNMVEHGFRAVYGRAPRGLPTVVANLAGVASSFGAVGALVSEPADLEPGLLRQYAASGKPVLLDIRIDPSESLSKGTRSAALRHFAVGGT